jgi:hypothetical protein
MTCDECGKAIYRKIFDGNEWRGVDCGCYSKSCHRSTVEAPAIDTTYDGLVLEHVHGDDGKPLRVTSSRQLAQAEQRHNFISVVRNMDAQNFNDAPQQKVFRVEDVYKRKFERRGW